MGGTPTPGSGVKAVNKHMEGLLKGQRPRRRERGTGRAGDRDEKAGH